MRARARLSVASRAVVGLAARHRQRRRRVLRQLAEEKAQLEEDLARAQRLVDWRGRQLQAAYWALASLQDDLSVDPTDPTRPAELYYLADLAPAAPAAGVDGASPAGAVPDAMDVVR